jgi:hypothetical protein
MASDQPSYIDYETFLSPSFSPEGFANNLVVSTNNPTDTTLDLSTPLSRVLFDIQEIDSHTHNLTTKSALPILEHVKSGDEASRRIVDQVNLDIDKLNRSYGSLEKEILQRYKAAESARLVSLRTLEVLRLGRAVARAVTMARQLETHLSESGLGVPGRAGKEDHRLLVRAVYTILDFTALLEQETEGRELQKIRLVKTLQTQLFAVDADRIKAKAQQIVREFSISNLISSSTESGKIGETSATSYTQSEEAKARSSSSLTILYLLSPVLPSRAMFQPDLLLDTLQAFLQQALTSSLASIVRSLTTLPSLDRTLLEVSARCQTIAAFELLLSNMPTPTSPLLPHQPSLQSPSSSSSSPSSLSSSSSSSSPPSPEPLLDPVLSSLDTSSLPSYFWRSLASALSPRVQEILNRGGASARSLRATSRDRLAGAIRQCVLRGGEGAGGSGGENVVD